MLSPLQTLTSPPRLSLPPSPPAGCDHCCDSDPEWRMVTNHGGARWYYKPCYKKKFRGGTFKQCTQLVSASMLHTCASNCRALGS